MTQVPNLFEFSERVPLTQDVWLGMQLRNILMVDQAILRQIELDALREFADRDKPNIDTLMILNAVSQMWIYSVYEFLRTWRQRARELLKIADDIKEMAPNLVQNYLVELEKDFVKKEQFVKIAPKWYSNQISNLQDKTFIDRLRDFYVVSEPLFRKIESVRVTLAKHEIPKTKGFLAEAPGYGRMNYMNGSLYWVLNKKDGSLEKFDRREFADDFYSL